MAAQRIIRVEAGGAADRAGVKEGDLLTAINGHPVLDLIDYQALSCRRRLTLQLLRAGTPVSLSLEKDLWQPLGLGFDQPLMSPRRDCINRCLFCFVDQLPGGARASLRVKDDDWRMSLMMGNFVTLTNVSEVELARIIRRKCAPLYISVHATEPRLRAKLLGQERGARIMEQLRALAEAGLSFHTQAVLCPGLNDGEALERTMEDLYELWPAARSLALVPVGLTGHRKGLYPIHPFRKEGAEKVLDMAEAMRGRALAEAGDLFVHPADEFYLIAGRPFPPEASYGEYPQIENGVGLCRLLESQFKAAQRELDPARVVPGKAVVACGVSVAPFLGELLEKFPIPGVRAEVRPLVNHFFGPSVTVSGLLTGGDLIRGLDGVRCNRLLISRAMLREGDTVFLDDRTVEEVEAALGQKITSVHDGEGLVRALSGWEQE
ncbi:MAG: DUF512 domain-containing protein [Candidatus Excrementavichristensenella sp.]|jgi:putative radical SAM enzyme (TIGR03279 family)